MRWKADVNMRSGSHARNGRSKCREGNTVRPQEVHQRLRLRSIRIHRDVHRVPVIQMPLIMNGALAKDGDRQWPPELLPKESVDLSHLR